MNSAASHPFRWVIGIGLALGLCWVLYLIRSVLTPFVIAFLASYALMSIVDRIEDLGMKRWHAILVVYVFFGLAMGTLMVLLVPILGAQLQSIQTHFNEYLGMIQQKAEAWEGDISGLGKLDIASKINEWGNALGDYVLKKAPGFISDVFSVAMLTIIVPLATFFSVSYTHLTLPTN